MAQPTTPEHCEQQPEETTARCFRRSEADMQASRRRGGRRGHMSRYGLRNLPPLDEEEEP